MTELAFGIRGNLPPEFAADVASAAEAHGYSAFWITAGLGPPLLAPLAAAANVTRTITLGVGAIPLSHCSAHDIATEVRRLDLPEDRLIVGVGSGFKPIPVARFAEDIVELKRTLTCPVVVGAMGPRTCELAGRESDGLLLTLVTPEHARLSVEWLGAGAAEAGRPAPRSYAYMSTAIGADALQQLAEEAGTLHPVPGLRAPFRASGGTAGKRRHRGQELLGTGRHSRRMGWRRGPGRGPDDTDGEHIGSHAWPARGRRPLREHARSRAQAPSMRCRPACSPARPCRVTNPISARIAIAQLPLTECSRPTPTSPTAPIR